MSNAESSTQQADDTLALLSRFESLGGAGSGGAEFATVQATFGLATRGLLRWAEMPEATLCKLLLTRLDGIGGARNVLVGPWPGSDEWWARDPRYPLAIRSGIHSPEHGLAGLTARVRRQWVFLRARLLEDLESGARIFVYRGEGLASPAMLDAALRTYPAARLLYVVVPDAAHPAGSVTAWSDHLLVGALPRPVDADTPHLDQWLSLCKHALLVCTTRSAAAAEVPALAVPAPNAPASASPASGTLTSDTEIRLRAAIESVPGSAQPHHALARFLAERNRLDEAIDSFAAAHAIEPGHPGHLSQLGSAQMRTGRFADAAETFRRATMVAPHNAALAGQLAVAAHRSGNLPTALAATRRALLLDPDNPRRLLQLAQFLNLANDSVTAEEIIRQAITLDPRLPDSRLALGQSLARGGRLAEALEEAHAALALQPHNARALGQIGRIAGRLGRFDEAEDALLRAIALEPGAVAWKDLLAELRQRRSQNQRHAVTGDSSSPETH